LLHGITGGDAVTGLLSAPQTEMPANRAGSFGWDMFSLPLWVRLLYLSLLLFVAVSEFSPKPFLGWERLVLLLPSREDISFRSFSPDF
jgi:hypothetical protein